MALDGAIASFDDRGNTMTSRSRLARLVYDGTAWLDASCPITRGGSMAGAPVLGTLTRIASVHGAVSAQSRWPLALRTIVATPPAPVKLRVATIPRRLPATGCRSST